MWSRCSLQLSIRICLVIAVFVLLCFGGVAAQSNSGTLELGMQTESGLRIDYEISGATITKVGEDNLDTVNGLSNERALEGVLETDQLRISGVATYKSFKSRSDSSLEVKIVDDSNTVLKTYTDRLDPGSGEMKFDLVVPVSKDKTYSFYIVEYGYMNYLHTVKVSGTLHPAAPPERKPPEIACDRLILDLDEGPNSVVIANVVDACEHKPLGGADLDIRIFHTWDEQLKKAINGKFVDLQMKTNGNGERTIQVTGNPGDIYRVDVYASKEGWDTSDRSIHVTIGGNTNLRFPQLGNRIEVDEIGQYFGEWTRIEGTDTFNAVWNGQITDVIEIQSIEGDQVTLYRHGNGGYYYGTLNEDGTITGTASWYEPGWTWSGTIEDA